MKPECIDNFLGKKEFDKLQKLFIGGNYENGLPWLYQPAIDYPDDLNKFQFIHVFYKNNKPNIIMANKSKFTHKNSRNC